jgi:glycosyltransferase involved in cell wall biosynthesis
MRAIGVVVIGRNEGERLKSCIRSFLTDSLRIVYVDSGSSDQSVDFVQSQGFDSLALDMSIPFSAGRARNEGYRFLLDKYDDIECIQFIDGDCDICSGWVTLAFDYLQKNEGVASVCGRRKERYPHHSIYNQLCDIEWDTPVGTTAATGGDFMCRKQALLAVNGFSAQVIAGEEPEMCFRMRQKGWKIERLDADMTLHDADMTSLSQMCKRYERSGHAYAQGFAMHGRSAEKYYQSDMLRILFWALCVPMLAIGAMCFVGVLGLLVLLVYPLKVGQIFIREKKYRQPRIALAYAVSLVLGKFPQLVGVMGFWKTHISGHQFQIIEYKR